MKVTVLIPVYNCEGYLEKCLDSVTKQTYSDLQIVIIDDGSIDKSLEICMAYAQQDARIEVYHQKNSGVASARNFLLSHIKGDAVIFIDSDDWIELNMLDFLVNTINKYNVDLVTCSSVYNDADVSAYYKERFLNRETLIKEFLIHAGLRGTLWNKLVKTSILRNVSFHSGISYGEDALFCWEYFQNVKSAIITDREMYHYRINPQSISKQTFGEKKMTGHEVWKIITNSVKEHWPQYNDIAKTRWAIEDLQLLIDAAHASYSSKELIPIRHIVKSNFINLLLSSLPSRYDKFHLILQMISFNLDSWVHKSKIEQTLGLIKYQ